MLEESMIQKNCLFIIMSFNRLIPQFRLPGDAAVVLVAVVEYLVVMAAGVVVVVVAVHAAAVDQAVSTE